MFSNKALKLTPSRIDSLLQKTPENKISFYDYSLQKSMFKKSVITWLFTPELSYSRNRLDEQDAIYNEGISLYLSIFSPQRLSSLSENYFSLKQSEISRRTDKENVFLSAMNDLFDYEYIRQKIVYDSINVKYAEKILELSREKLSLGLSDSLDFLRALDNFSSIKLTLYQDSMNLIVLEEKIRDLLGFKGDFVAMLDSFIPPDTDSISPIASKNIQLNLQLKKSALTGVYLAMLSILPEVGIKYSWDYTGNTFERDLDGFEYSKTFKVYLLINPLNFLFNVNRALLQYKKAQWIFKKSLLQEKQRFREYVRTLNVLEKKREVLRNRAAIKERSFILALEKYAQGELSFQDVLKEQTDYMALISEYLKVKLDIIKMRYNLWYNFGGSR